MQIFSVFILQIFFLTPHNNIFSLFKLYKEGVLVQLANGISYPKIDKKIGMGVIYLFVFEIANEIAIRERGKTDSGKHLHDESSRTFHTSACKNNFPYKQRSTYYQNMSKCNYESTLKASKNSFLRLFSK